MTAQIKKMLKYYHMTQKELAVHLNTSIANINNKLRRDNFTEKDLQAIADALGVELVVKFRAENGTEF